MQRVEKERIVETLETRLGGAKCLYLTDFTGLDVSEITELRRRLSEASVEYVVVKNTLARRAIADGPYEELTDELSGPSAFAWSKEDVVSPAKILTEFADEWEKPRIKAGAIEGRVVSLEEIGRIAKLPPREELLAKLVGSARSPVAGLVWTLHGLLAQFVRTLDAVRAKVEQEAPVAAPEVPVDDEATEPAEDAEAGEAPAPAVEDDAAEDDASGAEEEPETGDEPVVEAEAVEVEEVEAEEGDQEDEEEEPAATATAADAAEEDDEEKNDEEQDETPASEADSEK